MCVHTSKQEGELLAFTSHHEVKINQPHANAVGAADAIVDDATRAATAH
jgi:hypothetical protein